MSCEKHTAGLAVDFITLAYTPIGNAIWGVLDEYRDAEKHSLKEYDLVCDVLQKVEEAVSKCTFTGWTPCLVEKPKELVPVNVTWVNRKPASYYEHIKDKPFTATAIYYKGKWYWWSVFCEDLLKETGSNDVDLVDESIEIIAWMPLLKPYGEGDQE